MKREKAPIIDKVSPDLLVPPHIVGELIHILLGEWQPDSSQQEQVIAHFTECPYCRTALLVLLSAEQDYQKLNSNPEAPVLDLIRQFVTICHGIEALDYENMGAFAEAIVAEGREEGAKRYPKLAEHTNRCPMCKSTLEETVAFLNGSEETG